MLKVLFAAAESVPFIKTGGLADVIGSLPKYLKNKEIDVRVILPKYSDIPEKFKSQMTVIKRIRIPLGWRQKFCGIEELTYDGITFYFIDNEYYFKRQGIYGSDQGIYGYDDDAERYAYFCRAVLEALPHMRFKPDLIHCHDWHTSLISVFLKTLYQDHPFYEKIRTLFTIHNLKYQGIFPRNVLGDVLGLGDEYFSQDGLEFYGQINYLKGGLVFSDALSTVSRTYSQEIQTEYYGENLNGLLWKRRDDLYGIVNGIDPQEYDPRVDSHIFVNYDETALKKDENKMKLQEQLGLPVNKEIPMLAILSRLVEPKGLDLIACVLNELLQMDIQLVVLGTGESQYENLLRDAAYFHPQKMSANILFDNTLAHRIYAASDIFLMPSMFEPCGIGQLLALRYGSLPVVRETGGLKDTIHSYQEDTGEGNGFSFTNYNAHDMLYTIKRAIDFFYNKPVWNKIVQNAMESDYGWEQSSGEYEALYKMIMRGSR